MTTYTLDYVGHEHPIIGGIGQFGSYVREEVQRDEHGNLLIAPDGTPITKPVTVKYGPHEVSESVANQYDTPEMQELGWVVAHVESANGASSTQGGAMPHPEMLRANGPEEEE